MAFLRVNEINLYYRIRGTGAPIALLGGLSLDGGIFDPVAEALGSGFTTIQVDLRGSGNSDAPKGPYTVEMLTSDLRGLLTGLRIDRLVVGGHSLGGFIGLRLALDHPDRVRGLVLVSTAATGKPGHSGMSPEAKEAITNTRGSVDEIVRRSFRACLSERFCAEQPEAFERLVLQRKAHLPTGRGVQGQWAAASTFDIRSELQRIACPCLVIHGADDQVIPPARGRALAQGLPDGRFELLDGVGHMPQVEAPQELAESILDFTGQLPM